MRRGRRNDSWKPRGFTFTPTVGQLTPRWWETGGQERYVIALPHKEWGEENSFNVEIIVGKMMMTDGVNTVRLGGMIETKPLKGWGYTYYEVEKVGPGMSTKMAPRPGAKPVEEFVTMPPLQIRYNSRLPVVVYVPKGCEVRYRIWSAPEKLEKVEQG